MRKAAIASVAMHLGLIAGVWAFLEWNPTDDIGAETVSVDIISMEAFSTEPSEVITEASTTLISAGADFESMAVPEMTKIEAAEPDAARPVEAARLFAVAISESVEAEAEPRREPLKAKEPPKQAESPKKTPAKKQPQDKPPSKQASLGNSGAAEADIQASKKSGGRGKKDDGGSAAASKYPGLVQAKVSRAVKRPPKADGKSGEARVSFVVAANGGVASVALALSSGNATLDQAALAAVNRAAPFPPIPAAAGRSSWLFTVPIYFNR